ncbi:MAG: thermonuclease family protein [Minwuiales bacterium]|nr:thermonuclease family protein [Minwuiales bacterium]
MRTTLAAFIAAALALALPAAAADDLTGPATVIDGETLQVAGARLRLAGIDAPEPEQRCRRAGRALDCGQIAASQLADITAGATVVCRPAGPVRAGARLATCNSDGYDLSYGMVYAGWAFADGSPYRSAESEARSARRGIWAYDFVPPSEWRAGRRLLESE